MSLTSVTQKNAAAVSDTAKTFYDSDNAFDFYKQLWGGDHIHIGLYDEELQKEHPHITTEYIRQASHKSLDKFIQLLPSNLWDVALQAKNGTGDVPKFLDMGSGYGGCARHIASKYHCHVTCVDISAKESEHNRALTKEAGLDHLISVREASYTETKEEAGSFDVVYSIDSFIHAGDYREAAFTEASRILKGNGQGYFLLADPMEADEINGESQKAEIQKIYDRIHLDSMGSHKSYCAMGEKNGFELVSYLPLVDMLIAHYASIKHLLEERKGTPEYSSDFVDTMIVGLERWVKGGRENTLNYGYFLFRKL